MKISSVIARLPRKGGIPITMFLPVIRAKPLKFGLISSIDPEGGMSEAEVAALEAVGVRAVTLGPRILRTETAAVVAAALAMQLWGDL